MLNGKYLSKVGRHAIQYYIQGAWIIGKVVSFNPWVKISYVYQFGNSSFVCQIRTTQPLNYREKETIIFTDNPSVYAMLCKDFSKSIVEYIERTYEISKK